MYRLCRRYKFVRIWQSIGIQLVRSSEPISTKVSICFGMYIFSGCPNIDYLDLAYRSCRRLKLHKALATNDGLSPFFAEANRRSFWSCWASLCVNQHNSSFRDECWKEAEGLPLPLSEVSYNNGLPIAIESFDINGNIVKRSNIQESPHPSMIGELMKFCGLW